MKQSGWDNIDLWEELTEIHLIKMGFKDGHRAKFNYEYLKYKMRKGKIEKKFTFKNLLREWNLPIYLFDNMREMGCDDIDLWSQITDEQFKELGFKFGHIMKFKKHIKDNAHIKQFVEIKRRSMQNEVDETDDDDEEENKDDNDYIPNVPRFKIKDITNLSFNIALDQITKTERYPVEVKQGGDDKNYEWKRVANISQDKYQIINKLKMNTNYLIRVRAQNTLKKSKWSDIVKIKTKNKKWLKEKSHKIQKLEYHVGNCDGKAWIHFEQKEIKKIFDKQIIGKDDFKQKYSLEICLLENEMDINDEKQLENIVWNKIDDLDENKLIYEYFDNDMS
eukprot:386024_1